MTSIHDGGLRFMSRFSGRVLVAGVVVGAATIFAVSQISMWAAAIMMALTGATLIALAVWAATIARGVRRISRPVWVGLAVMLSAVGLATVATGIWAGVSGAEDGTPPAITVAWIAAGCIVLAGGLFAFRALRPTRGWQDLCDALLLAIVVGATSRHEHSEVDTDSIQARYSAVTFFIFTGVILAVVVLVMSNGSLRRGRRLTLDGGIVLGFAASFSIVVLNLVLRVHRFDLAVIGLLTILAAAIWALTIHLRLKESREVRIILPQERPSIWREIIPVVITALLVMAAVITDGERAIVGALAATVIVTARLFVTLVQYRRYLDDEHERLVSHERALIDERYARFAMAEAQSELADDNARLRGRNRDRVEIAQRLSEEVLLSVRALRIDLGRRNVHDASPTDDAARNARLGARLDGITHALEDLVMWSLLLEGQIIPTRRRVTVDEILGRAIEGLDDTLDRAGSIIQIDGDADVTIHADAELISLVLRRLVEASVLVGDRPSAITLQVRASDDVVVIEISDRGPAYTDDELASLFVPFRNVHGSSRTPADDVGLMYANAQSVISMHGGAIRVISPERGGVQVRISLPVYTAARSDLGVGDALHVTHGGPG